LLRLALSSKERCRMKWANIEPALPRTCLHSHRAVWLRQGWSSWALKPGTNPSGWEAEKTKWPP
jgi:hypothetical protein